MWHCPLGRSKGHYVIQSVQHTEAYDGALGILKAEYVAHIYVWTWSSGMNYEGWGSPGDEDGAARPQASNGACLSFALGALE